MINRTIGFLGLSASVMALSSLVYGAFQEPLGPYLGDTVVGALEYYRSYRNIFFSGIGALLSCFVSWIGNWLTWLPPMPWFQVAPIYKDVLILYLLFGSATFAWFYRMAVEGPLKRASRQTGRPIALLILKAPQYIASTILDAILIAAIFPIWPLILVQVFDWRFRPRAYLGKFGREEIRDGEKVIVYEKFPDNWLSRIPRIGNRWMLEAFLRSHAFVQLFMWRCLVLILATILFFLLAYAENHIGL